MLTLKNKLLKMSIRNFEFKARAYNVTELENKLLKEKPVFIGEDHQTDTYFNVAVGRLKLREGNIENALIWYQRENTTGTKQSDVLLYKHQPDKTLKNILVRGNGIKVIVEKTRKIYFIDNVKFHFDSVLGLGTFIEVEAIDKDGSLGLDQLKQQAEKYATFFHVLPQDFIAVSYSDLILEKE